jgi:GNAT superfamily N-acetyltransferase
MAGVSSVFSIRAANPIDRERLIKLAYDCRAAVDLTICPSYFRAFPPEIYSEIWNSTFANPQTQRAQVAWQEDNPIGYYRVGSVDPDYLPFLANNPLPPDTGELHQIYLMPGFQGLGLGKVFYEMAKRDLSDLGYKRFMICTYFENHKAKEFYRRQGAEPFADVVFDVNFSGIYFRRPASFMLHELV